MDATKVTEPKKMIMGIEVRTTNENNQAATDIQKAWERFYNESIQDNIPNKVSEEVFGLYTDYEKDHTTPYSLVIGCEVNNVDTVPTGMVVKTVPASNYAKYTAKGEFPTSVLNTWLKIWSTPLARTYTGDFEVYGNKFHQESPEVDVYIAISE